MSASTMREASAGALLRTLTTPSPSAAARKTSPIRRCVRGQISEPLRTTVLPQASGAASALTPRITGAFHGARPSTTPTGWRSAIAIMPGLSEGMISPAICVVIAAASRSMAAASVTLKRPQASVAPVSSAIATTKSGPRRSSSFAAAARRARRWLGPSADQAGKAAAAAAAAALASSTVAAAARVAISPVVGLRRSNTRPLEAGRSRSRTSSATSDKPASLPRDRASRADRRFLANRRLGRPLRQ